MNIFNTLTKVWKDISSGRNSPMSDPTFNYQGGRQNQNPRGNMIYQYQQTTPIVGIDKQGKFVGADIEFPIYRVTIQQRIEFVKMCSPLHALISGRMQKIASTNYKVVPIKDVEDREADKMKALYQIYKEFEKIDVQGIDLNSSPLLKYVQMRNNAKEKLMDKLPELLPDMSNFMGALMRWKRAIQNVNVDRGEEIQEWLDQPKNGVSFADMIKKATFDLHTHGAVALFKQADPDTRRLLSFDTLPGGSVYRIKNKHFSQANAYIQIVQGLTNQYFCPDEVAYMEYMPCSSQSFPIVSIESIINKLISYLLYDGEMALQADGTRPPEKILAVARKSVSEFADYDAPPQHSMDKGDQKRLEAKVNEPHRYPVIVVDVKGDVLEVIDIGKENILTLLDTRQDKIIQDIARIFNAMPFELGLSGTEFTSGRENSEAQLEHAYGKGVSPILSLFEDKFTKDILPYRYGYGYKIEFDKSENDLDEVELDAKRLDNGEITINELRQEKSKDIFDGAEFDRPRGAGPGALGENDINPLHIKQI